VTGDTGFKGSWLCEWLIAEGAEVFGIGLSPNTEPSLFELLNLEGRISHTELDIRNFKAVRDHLQNVAPEIVIHMAAQPLVRRSYEQPVETYETNFMGTVHILDAIREYSARTDNPIVGVMITTDKCYDNREWLHSYREEDSLGGYDPYSSSKGACELAIQSYRNSYFSSPLQSGVALASVRAGNVIGGGDWSLDRIIPDCVKALRAGQKIPVRNKVATRPWQHVLEPLGGYLLLAAELWRGLNREDKLQANFDLDYLCSAFNFGPNLQSNKNVMNLVEEVLKHWSGDWIDQSDPNAVHEASLLNLATDKAYHMLNWQPKWNFSETVKHTIDWYYREQQSDFDANAFTLSQIKEYITSENIE
jgi:CDP-glucose 4,6-dehydratase